MLLLYKIYFFDDLKPGTDLKALYENQVCISPLDLSLTNPQALKATRDYLTTQQKKP